MSEGRVGVMEVLLIGGVGVELTSALLFLGLGV